jgi:hypothetical protein
VQALDMLARDSGGIRRVVGAVVPLEEAAGAFPQIRAGSVLKVVVEP